MSLLPLKALLDGTKVPETTTAEMRTALGTLRDYLAAFLGDDSDNVATLKSRIGLSAAVLPPVGMRGEFYSPNAPAGWLKANGAAIAVDAYGALAAAIYCGDARNATALWGYRCTSASTPTTTRNTTGAYIVLPDARGEFSRGLDDGRGIDASRSLWGWQAGQLLSHSHGVNDPAHNHGVYDPSHAHAIRVYDREGAGTQPGNGSGGGWGGVTENATTGISLYAASTGISIAATGGGENLVRNLAALVCIKY